MAESKKSETRKKIRLYDVWKFLKNSLVAILRGELLLRLNVGKYFPQIAYTFLLFALTILFSLMVDGTLGKVEQNKLTLQELERLNSQKTFELITLNRRSTVATLLEEQGSDVTEPTRPAQILK